MLEQFIDPVSQRSLKELKAIKSSEPLCLSFGFPVKGYEAVLKPALEAHLGHPVEFKLEQNIRAHKISPSHQPIDGVKNIIAISSAKGGVGKSTVAVNIALALKAQGAQVGILDADIYGPSIPHMLGSKEQPKVKDDKLFPVLAAGLQTMSIDYLTEEDTPIIWRGPMVTRALQQLLTETLWQDLDYLIIDMPPGTGDLQLTLAQKVPVAGAVVVTTPQPIACLDAVKGYKMFEKVNVPVLGLIENMSGYQCPHCHEHSDIFGHGGGAQIASEVGIRFLGSVPLDAEIRAGSDDGQVPHSNTYEKFMDLARAMAAQLSLQAKDYTSQFPEIIIENN